MPEQFEQHFGKKEEKRKEISPEEYNEARQYVEELKEIKEKQNPTEEDLKRVKELIERIKEIFSPEKLFESEKAKKRLESLKKTPLWDETREQWNEWMNKDQKLLNSNRSSDSQLLGVLAEAVTGNISQAKKMLEALKKTPLWDEKREQWNLSMDEEQRLRNSYRSSHDQLLGVLAEAVTGNISKAKKMLESLKKTPLWDQTREQWNYGMNGEQKLGDLKRFSHTQLLGVLAEAVTGNISQAKKMLEALKKTPLWDETREQWTLWMNKKQELEDSNRFSDSQLLGVLAEAFDEKPEKFVKWLLGKGRKNLISNSRFI